MPPGVPVPGCRLRGQESAEECSHSWCREDKEHEAKPASAQTQAEEAKPASAQTQAEELAQVSELSGVSSVQRIWERLRRDWGRRFFARLDLQGRFHTYPYLGGPFQSLLDVDQAIDCYLEERRDPKMSVGQDKAIIHRLYWPDGTVKRRTRSPAAEKSEMCQLAQALVDKYNEDHNLLEDLAHELKDVLHYWSICENLKFYYHLNFTTKIKGAGSNECSVDNLFFVELKCLPQGKFEELLVNCFCPVNQNDNGHCYGCTRNGDDGMKHPNNSVAYTAGHLKVRLPFGSRARWKRDYDDEEDDDKYVKAREAELRQMLGLDKPVLRKKLCTPTPQASKRKVLE